MTKEKYPLHPGQTEVSPYYVQIPQSEYESMKRENAQLHALLQGTPRQSPNAEIDTLTSEVKALREMNVKAQEEIAALKDSQRWRKCNDGLPEEDEDEDYLVFAGGAVYIAAIMQFVDDHGKPYKDFFIDYATKSKPTHWMPKPKAPEELG